MSNRLKDEKSPYLLQHKDNPVDWYPWGEEAFFRAESEDKPIFLSIGYSFCHWCHVLAHESFEDEEIADILNKYFICVKVDREERPDIDSVYMAVCQAFTGSGGWPMSIFMTADKKPFFAGTYFPKTSRSGMIGLKELLMLINEKWKNERSSLLEDAEGILEHLKNNDFSEGTIDMKLIEKAVDTFLGMYDKRFGGFGRAPKFPTPHNIIFLLSYYERYKKAHCLNMAEHTLMQMYRGGMFDHIGFGFCRYSTDKMFLVPHFEKMLYDNALLILSYCKAYTVTGKCEYLEIAEKTADYILREMTSSEGGFFSAQDADSDGEEGKYYLFTPDEIINILGREEGEAFNSHYDISIRGNFEGKNIPNLLKSAPSDRKFDDCLIKLRDYRKNRYSLHLDDKILTVWNSLMIGAMSELYLCSRCEKYLEAAQKADEFIRKYLCENDNLFVSFREGHRGVSGFLDDYAAYIFAQLQLYRVTLSKEYLEKAKMFCDKAISLFGDSAGGFFLYGEHSEELILRPKETYDGAIPSGNSLIAYDLVRLLFLSSEEKYQKEAQRQLDFMSSEASVYPQGYSMYLTALLQYFEPSVKVTVVYEENIDIRELIFSLPHDAVIILTHPTAEYPLINGKTTYYVCKNHSCFPPQNNLNDIINKE